MNPRWVVHMPVGVSLKRIRPPETIMHERLNELVGVEIGKEATLLTYDKLPEYFVVPAPPGTEDLVASGFRGGPISPTIHAGEDAWPPNTNLRCCSCTLTFQGFPWFVPLGVDVREGAPIDGTSVKRKLLAFRRGQVTCSPNCAVTFIERNHHGEEKAQLKELLAYLYYVVTGRWVIHITPAPRHTQLQAYGGDLSDQEFWTKMRELAQQTHLSVRKFDFPLLDADEVDGANGWGAAEEALPFEKRATAADFPPLSSGLPAQQRAEPRPVAPAAAAGLIAEQIALQTAASSQCGDRAPSVPRTGFQMHVGAAAAQPAPPPRIAPPPPNFVPKSPAAAAQAPDELASLLARLDHI